MIKQKVLVIFSFLLSTLGIAQLLEVKPEFATRDQLSYSFNPSTNLGENELTLDVAYRNRFQDFAAIRSFYSLLSVPVSDFQTIHIEAISDQNGPFFQKNRLYIGYAIGIELNDQLKLNLGVSGGVVNYNMKSNSGGVGGSDFVTDASAGISISHSSGLSLGMSWQQFLNRKLQPIAFEFLLERHLELQLSYKKRVNEDLKIEFLARGLSDESFFTYARIFWYDQLLLGLNYNSGNNLALVTGYKFNYEDEFNIGLNASYSLSTKGLEVDKRTFELQLTLQRVN